MTPEPTQGTGAYGTVQWAPQCPNCGSPMAGGATVLGDEISPRGTARHHGEALECPSCGLSVVVSPDLEWIPMS